LALQPATKYAPRAVRCRHYVFAGFYPVNLNTSLSAAILDVIPGCLRGLVGIGAGVTAIALVGLMYHLDQPTAQGTVPVTVLGAPARVTRLGNRAGFAARC
jgi:hypothetical protein